MSEPAALSLSLHGRSVETVFDLLGDDEEDMTNSLGWVLAHSPAFLGLFTSEVLGRPAGPQEVHVRLQEYEKSTGFTDIEIEETGKSLTIVEAKKGWVLPSDEQLAQYARRISTRRSRSDDERLLVLSECNPTYAMGKLPKTAGEGIPVEYVSWDAIRTLLSNALPSAPNAEKRLLRELGEYLAGEKAMSKSESNLVYVVALAVGKPEGWSISWRDIVLKRERYFHPVGRGYPKEPPNYVGFRYEGRLQRIHHVEDVQIVTEPPEYFDEPSGGQEWNGPYFLYELGPAFGTELHLPYGKAYRSGTLWCMLDTLFTCKTLAEAVDVTRERRSQAG